MSEVLRGVRVVELASWTYVPSAGAALADWGADVIKVEPVQGGDPGRALVVGGFTKEAARAKIDFILEIGNRGKRSIAIDVKSPTGREYFGKLLATADVFLTNWLPGPLERARLTVDDIRGFNPNIIIARGTATGVRGPDRDRGGFDAATYLSRGGVSYTMTPFGTETPAVQGPGFGDLQGGITLAGGVCAALFHRERTGEPTIVDSSLLAQAMWTIAPSISVADLFDMDGIPGAPPGMAASNGRTSTVSAPPTPAPNAARVHRSMFTHGSRCVIIGSELTAWMVAAPASGAPATSATRAQSWRAARIFAIVRNWSSSAARRKLIWRNASATGRPASVSSRT